MDKTVESLSTEFPYMSDNTVAKIVETLGEMPDNFHLVEYGAGNSTLFFLKLLLDRSEKSTFISVDFSYHWFQWLKNKIVERYGELMVDQKLNQMPWSLADIIRFGFGKNMTTLNVPDDLKRLSKSRKKLTQKLIAELAKSIKGSNDRSFVNGTFQCAINQRVNYTLELRSQIYKDQYGESPLKDRYIEAGLKLIQSKLESNSDVYAAFIIDGGPRGDILERLLDLQMQYQNFKIAIFMLEAQRIYYNKYFSRCPEGVFIKGSNCMLSGGAVYEPLKKSEKLKSHMQFVYGKQNVTAEEMAEKEMWFYRNF